MNKRFTVEFDDDVIVKITSKGMEPKKFLNNAVGTYLYLLSETDSNSKLKVSLTNEDDVIVKDIELPK